MKNIIKESAILRIPITPTMKDKQGKTLTECDIAAPGLKDRFQLIATIAEEDNMTYSGFTMGNVLDRRERTDSCNIDLSKKDFKCIFNIAPNDKKKAIEEVGDVVQNIMINVTDKGKNILGQKTQLTLTKPEMDIDIDTGSLQVQQGEMKSIKVLTTTPESKILLIKAALIGPGKLFHLGTKQEGGAEAAANTATGKTSFTAKPGEDIELGYQAPAMGNFDIANAINTLSMWDLQKDAGKQIAKDAILNFGGEAISNYAKGASAYAEGEKNALGAYQSASKKFSQYYDPSRALGYVRNANDAKQYSDQVEILTKTYTVIKKGNDIINMPSKITKVQGNIQTNVNDAGNSDVGWKERWSNYGITGINIAQTTVGVLTFIPNKLPGVNKLGAGLKTAFSAASNIVKADLQYIAQAEKIDRAQEILYPVPVVVYVEDENGWGMTAFLVIKVAYQEV